MIPNGHITIYNRYIASRAEKYQRFEIYDVVWQATKAVSGSKSGLLASNIATIFIPYSQGTQYAGVKAWQALTDKSFNFTLQEGDVIVRNIVADEIVDATEEDPAFTITDLRAKYDEVVSITSVDAMDQGSPYMQHWEVGCR